MQNVLITGAAGGVGGHLRRLLKPRYAKLRLSDLKQPADLAADEDFVAADLADLEQTEQAVAGMDGIVHLGGFSVEGDWDVIHPANIVGTYNLFEAARRQGVKRVIFASSNHAVGFYRRKRRIGVNERVRPDSRYGVSKAYGEALGSLYADKYGLRVMSIRIGNVDLQPIDHRRLSIWLHPEDLADLIHIGLTHPDMYNEVVFGASDNERGWWDNEPAYRLGYRPKHRAEDHLEAAREGQKKVGPDAVGDLFEGGAFCSMEFDNDPDRP